MKLHPAAPVLLSMLLLTVWAMFGPLPEPRAAWLRWDANPPQDGVTDYRIHSGPASRRYTTNWKTGNVTTSPIPTLPAFYAVTALDDEGNESGYSAEIFFAPRPDCPSVVLLVMQKRTVGEPWKELARLPVASTNGSAFFQLRIEP